MQDFLNQLNQANTYGTYSQSDADTIVGAWRMDAQTSGNLGSNDAHFDYQVIVTLSPADKTFSYTEKMHSQNTGIGPGADMSGIGPTADPFQATENQQPTDGSINLFSKSSENFQGRTWGTKQMGFSHQFGSKSGNSTISYDFDADKIKLPLLRALENAGYSEKKKSLFGKLFGK